MSSLKLECRYYAAGICSKGSKCPFSHINVKRKTEQDIPCEFFLAGNCKYGKNCIFSHGKTKTKSSREKSRTAPQTKPKPAIKKIPPPKPLNGPKKPAWGAKPIAKSVSIPIQKRDPFANSDESDDDVFFFGGHKPFTKKDKVIEVGVPQPVEKAVAPKLSGYAEAVGDVVPEQTAHTLHQLNPEEQEMFLQMQDDMIDMLMQQADEEEQDPVCHHFLNGYCMFGDSCMYRHEATLQHSADEIAKKSEEFKESKDAECGICFENPLEKGEKFGLLSGCDHCFCLNCIRRWRNDNDQTKDTMNMRVCPLCRNLSHFIVPCDRMISDPERKDIVVEEYKAKLASIPCAHYDHGKGICPFGQSCFYSHTDLEGNHVEVPWARTWRDAEGNCSMARPLQLTDFFV
eukprot:TRINITY_DN534612_c0_g1_i1.p1 TRINITY_DN534612_c0_g1~~TRINITY_DN534612_c0_g1_i1.p1  ORF type:complete len:409 (-),score=104.70 TRINITY_DN534612_c0_g1_i1:103-1305(-)